MHNDEVASQAYDAASLPIALDTWCPAALGCKGDSKPLISRQSRLLLAHWRRRSHKPSSGSACTPHETVSPYADRTTVCLLGAAASAAGEDGDFFLAIVDFVGLDLGRLLVRILEDCREAIHLHEMSMNFLVELCLGQLLILMAFARLPFFEFVQM